MVSRQGHAVVKVFQKAGDGLSIIASIALCKQKLNAQKERSQNEKGIQWQQTRKRKTTLLMQKHAFEVRENQNTRWISKSLYRHCRIILVSNVSARTFYTAFAKNCGLVREQPLSSTNFFTTLDNCTNYEIEASRAYLHLAVSNWTQRTNCPPATIATEILIRLVKVLSVAQSSSLSQQLWQIGKWLAAR